MRTNAKPANTILEEDAVESTWRQSALPEDLRHGNRKEKKMNLEQFKDALASDARKKVDRLERGIKKLEKEVKSRDDVIKGLNDILLVMFNRCAALTMGAMCGFCKHKDLCREMRERGR